MNKEESGFVELNNDDKKTERMGSKVAPPSQEIDDDFKDLYSQYRKLSNKYEKFIWNRRFSLSNDRTRPIKELLFQLSRELLKLKGKANE